MAALAYPSSSRLRGVRSRSFCSHEYRCGVVLGAVFVLVAIDLMCSLHGLGVGLVRLAPRRAEIASVRLHYGLFRELGAVHSAHCATSLSASSRRNYGQESCNTTSLPEARLEATAADDTDQVPEIVFPAKDSAFGTFWLFGWKWSPERSLDENLMRLSFAIRLNCFRMRGYNSGQCSALLCRPPVRLPSGRLRIEIVGFGVNAPPRFAPVANTRRDDSSLRQDARSSWMEAAAMVVRRLVNVLRGAKPSVATRDPEASRTSKKSNAWKTKRNYEIHAEIQLLSRCARAGQSVRGLWMYVSLPPCWNCCKALVASGLGRVISQDFKPFEKEVFDPGLRQRLAAEKAGIEWVLLTPDRQRDDYVDELWGEWKRKEGMDRARIKAMGSDEPF